MKSPSSCFNTNPVSTKNNFFLAHFTDSKLSYAKNLYKYSGSINLAAIPFQAKRLYLTEQAIRCIDAIALHTIGVRSPPYQMKPECDRIKGINGNAIATLTDSSDTI